ncbi:MAG: zinc-dependent metalloprotease [Planctomycetota bacterium]
MRSVFRLSLALALSAGLWNAGAQLALAQEPAKDFPPFEEVTKDYTKVVSTADGAQSLYTVYTREKDGQMLAELPRDFENKKYFIALTISSGERFAGLQAGDMYVYWKRFDKRLALVEPDIGTRSNGDQESKSSVDRLYTDRVILDVPIVTQRIGHGPVIDLDELLLGEAEKFYGPSVRGANRRLASIKQAKAFPQNIEVAYELPMQDGRLKSLYYSFSDMPDDTGYKPRKADERVGYFTTAYQDLGQYDGEKTWVRFINRWNLEKADPALKLSPPKRPIVFFIEHTTPIRYRRFVRDGLLMWNKAFEKVGIVNAIEVYYQDARTGQHMDKDPEDVRFNFIRWLNNDISTAIGPSRVHPLTGEIRDADIILTDGWIRTFNYQFVRLLPQTAMEGFGPDALAWLADHPEWDPRLLLASPHERCAISEQIAKSSASAFGGHPLGLVDGTLLGDDEFDGLVGRHSQVNGLCMAAAGKSLDLAKIHMFYAILPEADKAAEKSKDGEAECEKEDLLDGMPAKFIGPMLADLVAHEVGHTLGLRHNFKASALHTLAEVNSAKLKGKAPYGASVMDYNPINVYVKEGELQGDYTMIDIGAYDFWAIEYGYSFADDLQPVLARCTEPAHRYATDEDTMGPDPLARRYDFSANPIDYCRDVTALVTYLRERLLERFVKNNESWAKARNGYDLTLNLQVRNLSMMANWIGGAFVSKEKKGDPNGKGPIEPVPAETQRAALKYVIDHAFRDQSFGLTPELLRHMSVDKWYDGGGIAMIGEDSTYPVHDRVMGIQSMALTMIMNPTTLRRVYDNETQLEGDKDAVTLPEVLESVHKAIWGELSENGSRKHSARQPMITSLRRNLQREHVERLIDLSLTGRSSAAAFKSISSLARMSLRNLAESVGKSLEQNRANYDEYTMAHLKDCELRIQRALDAQLVIGTQVR